LRGSRAAGVRQRMVEKGVELLRCCCMGWFGVVCVVELVDEVDQLGAWWPKGSAAGISWWTLLPSSGRSPGSRGTSVSLSPLTS
ncbi:hypothetical protein LQL77_32150, partial [Rhodococcus cerastii]|nr:hypothetical protein [Rhodococcus cerastii]